MSGTPGTPTGNGIVAGLSDGALAYLHSVRLFSRNARLYLLGAFLIGINSSVFSLLFNLYLKEKGFAEGDIGLVNSCNGLGMTLVAIPAAIILSRVRLKPLLIVCTVLFAVFSVGMTSFAQWSLLLGSAVLTGMSTAVFRVASGPFVMRNSSSVERTHLFAFAYAMQLLAGMIGSWAAGAMAAYVGNQTGDLVFGYQVTLYAAIALGFLAFIPFALVKADDPVDDEDRITLNMEQLRRRGGFYLKLTTVNFVIGTGAGLIIPFLNLYFRDRFSLPPDRIGFYFILLTFGMLVGTLAGPVLTRRFGMVRTIVLTQSASIPFMLILAYSYWLPLVVPAFIIRGALMNLGSPINTNFGMELSEKQEQGLVNALLSVAWTSSWMISVAIGGKLIETHGYTVTLNISVALYIISIGAYWLFFRHVERRHPDAHGWHIPQDTQV